MNTAISIEEIQTTGRSSSDENETVQSWKDIMQQYAALISIVFPLVTYLALKDSIRENALLKFITVLLPCTYSSSKNLLLLLNNRNHGLPLLFRFVLNSLFLAFTIVSILLTILSSLDEWNSEDILCFHMIFPSLVVLPAYLLSTSSSLETNLPSFASTSDIDVLLDSIILLSIVIGIIMFFNEGNKHYPHFAIASVAITLIRSLSKRSPSPILEDHARIPRLTAFIFILLLAITVYVVVGIPCLYALRHHSKKLTTLLSTNK